MTLTKKQALEMFNELCPRESFMRIQSNGRRTIDTIARNEAWNNWTDILCKDRQITPKQYDTWMSPWG